MTNTISWKTRMLIGTAAFALTTGYAVNASQSQSAADSRAQAGQSGAQQVTITGCVQREADYRKSTGAGRGGAVGTGVGAGNEFILANAMMAPASGATTGTSGAGAASATGTSGGGATAAYELTGPNEGKADSFVGKRVEVMGTLKAADAAAGGGATGGPTAAVPGSQDLKLRELEVSSIRETTGTCTP